MDTDSDAWSRWVTLPDGSPDRIWREREITALLTGHTGGHLFLAGCKSNQGGFYPLLDQVVLLSAPADVLLARIERRTGNPYGKRPEERAAVLRHLATVEPLLRATASAEIDATAPVADVVGQVESLAGPLPA
ncbi:nucleoside/nucleotide kinase family protein [Streptomyces marincola]|uniref:ATP-binding protein n=1 Tax=Streptomyces marincola TaxID=2878388 RepID=UPI001CF3CEE2|nr:ATP-binding protein [Streptomyces marincola]UCM87196.1 ATP-binding protein [Streptomyces marincola]